MQLKDLPTRIEQLLEQSSRVLNTKKNYMHGGVEFVDSGALSGFRASVLSFIAMVYGKDHSHYSEFDTGTNNYTNSSAKRGHAILLAIQNEIEGGWVFSVKHLVAAEIFSDFLEMAEHLLSQGYKDPAAVMIGSVLEENLRQQCLSNEIDIELEKDDRVIAKKADRLNSDLAKAGIYTKLDQKAVTMWLDLRNKAAHGKYEEYTRDQVDLMFQGVTDFLARVSK